MNTLTLSVSALLLDMDGTLVCSTGDVEKVWRLWCQHHQLAPEPYLLGAKRLGISPARCLVFEDATAGIESALRAGCTVVQVGGDAPLNPAVVAVIRDWREVKVEIGETSLLVTLLA
ncbi:HAD family hydrolase [Aeromonas veronii]|uniref:HAD family hydrolase n=1 Tax=Aeromonas veronii TaxID=654 RepID=UPI001BCC534C|nr:HAD-IA family hydrolase [Aeromonas veronii]MBS4723331.1 HAD-IA family hydrolase [Aeromonas veronii]